MKPYGSLNGTRFLKALKQSLDNASIKTHKESFALFSEARIRLIPLDEIKRTIRDKNIGKKDLLFIAQKRLGIPTGTLRKLRRELIQDRILNEIENIEKFDTIRKKAAE